MFQAAYLEESICERLLSSLSFRVAEAVIPNTDRHGGAFFKAKVIVKSESQLVWFPGEGLTACSATAFSIPACSIRSLTFFCRSSIRLPISSSSVLRRASSRGPSPQKPSKTPLQMAAPDQVTWHQGPGSATCDTRESEAEWTHPSAGT